MSDDDDLATTYDLDAWAPPAPSAGLADRVIAELRRPPAVVAIEPEAGATPRRRWIIAGLAAALAAAAAIAIVVGTMRRAPANGSGAAIADRARSVELGDSRVELDPGAELTWERSGDRVRAVLRRGAATIRIAGDDTFVIDGAGLASVEASGASLRLEATMNLSDARVIGASAVTAAAVAMLTIVVYEGRVKATHGGQTVNIDTGGTLAVRAPGPEPEPERVGAAVDLQAQIDEKDREIERLRRELEDVQSVAVGGSSGRPVAKKPPSPPASCDADALAARGDEQAASGMWAAALASWEASMRCTPNAQLTVKAAMAACNTANAAKANLYLSRLDQGSATKVLQICLRNGVPVQAKSSDCVTLAKEKGQESLQNGQDATALNHFETALACGAGADVERLAMIAACRAKDAERARRHAARLGASERAGIEQICVRNGIDLSDVKSFGTLQVSTQPPSRVFVNGKEYGQTPLVMNIVPGKHKITFQVGDAKYTYPVVVEAGKTISMKKSLE